MEEFSSIGQVVRKVMVLSQKYGLRISHQDTTLYTFKARLYINEDSYVQIYYNVRKNKFLLALVKNNNRVYGFDKLDEDCHEHPPENPREHLNRPCPEMNLEKFISKAIKLVKEQSHG